MDTHNVPITPEWRPASGLSATSRSTTPTSSIIFSPPPPSSHALLPTSFMATGTHNNNMASSLEPYETSACERLTQQIVRCSERGLLSSSLSNPPARPLDELLQETCLVIRFNAKWFAPAPLSILLQTAFNVASRSSSTLDLVGALNLIDTILTYSLLPTLLPAARFIAYCYYQGTRSNRHKKLTQHAWAVAHHILGSHLGAQLPYAVLDIMVGLQNPTARYEFAAAVGSLIMTTQELLPERDPSLPHVHAMSLIRALHEAPIADSAVVREHVTHLLDILLRCEHSVSELERDGSLGDALELLDRCFLHSLEKDTATSILNSLETKMHLFEPRHLTSVGIIFLQAKRPLPPAVSRELLISRRSLATLTGSMNEHTTSSYCMLAKMCDSDLYLTELAAFVKDGPDIPNNESCATLRKLMELPTTTSSAVEVLAGGILMRFTRSVQSERDTDRIRGLLFDLYDLSRISREILKFLLRIRVDAAGQAYLEVDKDCEPDNQPDGFRYCLSNLPAFQWLPVESWGRALHNMMADEPARWDVYDALLTYLGPQIQNHAFWLTRSKRISVLQETLCRCLNAGTFVEPPDESGKTKSYVVGQLLQILTATITYHRQLHRNGIKAAISTILNVAGSRDHSVSIHCIHALSICCFELPEVMANDMDKVIDKMTRLVTQRHLALYVLEFFSGLSRFPELQDRLRSDDFKRIFGVCRSYLQSIRSPAIVERKRTPASDRSAGMSSSNSNDDMTPYVYALTHHVITFWYMALREGDRKGLKEYITNGLKYVDSEGKEHIEDQGLVTIDLMDRVDAEEQINALIANEFNETDGRVLTRHRITGVLMITTETALRTGKTMVTIRRPSGTARRLITSQKRHDSANTKVNLDAQSTASVTVEGNLEDYLTVFPDDITGRTYGKVFIPDHSSVLGSIQVIELPEETAVTRAINSFDRTSALDSHKAGIIYVGEGQTEERSILLNQSGTPAYRAFLHDMGSDRPLKDATFNTQGLDRHGDADGTHTIVWNNEVTELVYHVTTFMPNDPEDERMAVTRKKSHIGNDFVNIVWNDSGGAYRLDTIPSAFNAVNIVIVPSDRTTFLQARGEMATRAKEDLFYNVHVLTRPGHPNLSSASEVRVVCGASLGGYVRNLALNACVFSAVWQGGEMGEYPSSWRQRLHMIRRLYEKYSPQWG